VSKKGTRQRPALGKGTRQRPALGKEALCRVLEKKHSAKYLTLGKDFFSGSDQSPVDSKDIF
jgi:hypothetical protein